MIYFSHFSNPFLLFISHLLINKLKRHTYMKLEEILKTQNHMAFLKVHLEEHKLKILMSNINISHNIRTYSFDINTDWFFKIVYADGGVRVITLKNKEKNFDLIPRFFGLDLDAKNIKTICSYVNQIICSGKL